MKKNTPTIRIFGFTLVEGIITILLIAIVASLGSKLLISSFTNYVSQRDIQRGLAECNIVYDRVIYSYLNPLFKLFHKPLYRDLNGEVLIFATSHTAFNQTLSDSKTFLSQLIRIEISDNTLKLSRFFPPNLASDTLYDDSALFQQITLNTPYKATTTLAQNINQFQVTYFDATQQPTQDVNTLVNIGIFLSMTRQSVIFQRIAILSPWKLLWQ